ncbi:MAG: hypothetical protein QM775_14225 [Pirellulales bacterium]
MAKLRLLSHPNDNPVIYSVPEAYSMPIAVQLLKHLLRQEDCKIEDASWKSSDYGNLVEVGIPVRLGTIEFRVMSSYGDIFLYRRSGNKTKFYELCETIGQMEFAEEH